MFRDPYLLDFLGLKDTFAEKDLEAAILRDMEAFILELGIGYQCDTDFWDPYFDVKDRKGESKNWEIEYVGKETEGWKMMVNYFKLNSK